MSTRHSHLWYNTDHVIDVVEYLLLDNKNAVYCAMVPSRSTCGGNGATEHLLNQNGHVSMKMMVATVVYHAPTSDVTQDFVNVNTTPAFVSPKSRPCVCPRQTQEDRDWAQEGCLRI